MGDSKPGLLIIDMSNDQTKGVVYNRAALIENIAQLAMSDFFHLCIESKAEVPAFRAKQRGAQIIDELAGFDHLKSASKKEDSAISNPQVLEILKGAGITHVCVCGHSTDSSIYATAKDLVANGFEIFVVKDATTSKNGRFGHDKGLKKIQAEFGENTVVSVDELLGEEEMAEANAKRQASAAAAPPKKQEMTDAERLAARKKEVDAARFAHIKNANAAAMQNADAKRAAEIQKNTAEAEKFAQNLPQNKKAQATASTPPPVPAPVSAAPSPSPAASAPAQSTTAAPAGKPSPQPASSPASEPPAARKKAPSPAPAKSGGFMCCFGDENGVEAPSPSPSNSKPSPSPAPASSNVAPSPAPAAAPVASSTPESTSLQPPVPTAEPEQKEEQTAPVSASKPLVVPAPPGAEPVSATAVPGGAAGQKTWIKPKPEGQKTTSYTPDGAVAQPLGVKKMVQGDAVQERIAGLQEDGLSTVPMGPRKMKTPKIVTDTKETWDREGNITREITRYITEIDGTKRTEKEIVKIPAKK